jgi:hypothetical protein
MDENDVEWRILLLDAFEHGRKDSRKNRVVIAAMGGMNWRVFWHSAPHWIKHHDVQAIRNEYERGWYHDEW